MFTSWLSPLLKSELHVSKDVACFVHCCVPSTVPGTQQVLYKCLLNDYINNPEGKASPKRLKALRGLLWPFLLSNSVWLQKSCPQGHVCLQNHLQNQMNKMWRQLTFKWPFVQLAVQVFHAASLITELTYSTCKISQDLNRKKSPKTHFSHWRKTKVSSSVS